MIDVKQAVTAARNYASDTLGTSSLLLEEIRSDDNVFHITLSFPSRSPDALLSGRSSFRPSRYSEREFKVFDVSKQSGDVVGMQMRILDALE